MNPKGAEAGPRRAVMVVATLVAVPLALAYVACGGNNGNLPPPPLAPPAAHVPVSVIASASASAAPVASESAPDAGARPAAPRLPAPVIALWSPSPDPPTPTPVVHFATPFPGQVIALDQAPDFEVKLDVRNWRTATASQSVSLVLDNGPFRAIHDLRAPTKLRDLLGSDVALTEGQHVLVAFPTRANRESVKTPGALAILEFYVGRRSSQTVDISKPMLIYGQPKGEYKGDMAGHILIDFQLANTTLADDGNVVTISVTGPGVDANATTTAQRFGLPFYFDNAQTGAYTFKLELVDRAGVQVPGTWNSTIRTIHVDRAMPIDPTPLVHGLADGGAP